MTVRRVQKSALVPYRASEMYALVNDVDRYAEFLPWCRHSEVTSREAEQVEATLELHKGAISKTFSTRNTLTPDSAIGIELLGGPFRQLSGGWQFDALGDAGSRVSLDLEFEFESRVVDTLFGPFFEEICDALIDAFTRRAEEVYGER